MAIRRSAVCSFFFFFNDTATTEIYTLSLHDALPISYIAGGLELSEAVSGARAAAERARAMVDGSPLPLALVDGEGRVQQLNEAGCRLFGIAAEREARGAHLEALGLSPSGISLRLVLAQPLSGGPWHGRVLVTQASGDRRVCDCTITGLSGIDSKNLPGALYDRTDERRAGRGAVARRERGVPAPPGRRPPPPYSPSARSCSRS